MIICIEFKYGTFNACLLISEPRHSINPFVTNGLSHFYHLDESTFVFRGIKSNFSFLFHFPMKIM